MAVKVEDTHVALTHREGTKMEREAKLPESLKRVQLHPHAPSTPFLLEM
jgi:hypothetical protein